LLGKSGAPGTTQTRRRITILALTRCINRHLPERSTMEFRLEVVLVPVSDVDRAKAFYSAKVGFNLDHDRKVSDEMRIVQLTPPGSACSIVIGTGLPEMEPGCLQGVQLVVADLDAARQELADRGVEVGEIQQLGPEGSTGSRFVFFNDPDGNGWAVQEIRAHE